LGRNSSYISLMTVSLLLAASFGLMLSDGTIYDAGDGGQNPESGLGAAIDLGDGTWKSISTPQELALIGSTGATAGAYPLNGKYYLANDIVFGPADTNGGVAIGISIDTDASAGTVTVTLTPDAGDVKSLYAWLGNSFAKCADDDTLTLTNVMQGTFVLTVAGTLDTGVPFACSLAADTAAPATISGQFSSNGNFDPIGSESMPFRGSLHGNGKKIVGMNVAVFGTSDVYAGLFGYTGMGVCVYDLGIEGGSVTVAAMRESEQTNAHAGAIIGMVCPPTSYGSPTPAPMLIEGCYNTSMITAAVAGHNSIATVGGLIGSVLAQTTSAAAGLDITISGCHNAGRITSSSLLDDPSEYASAAYAGGLVGNSYQYSSATVPLFSMNECYNEGPVTAITTSPERKDDVARAGGLISKVTALSSSNRPGTVTVGGCHNTAPVTSLTDHLSNAGGIICEFGFYTTLYMSDCHNTGPITASAFAAFNSVGPHGYAAGLVAVSIVSEMNIKDSSNEGTIKASSPRIACAGGLLSYPQDCVLNMDNCFNEGPVTAAGDSEEFAGGLIAEFQASSPSVIENCYNTATVEVSGKRYSRAGGFAGVVVTGDPPTIRNCYNTGPVTSSLTYPVTYVCIGGMIGETFSEMTIENCYTVGRIAARPEADIGGLIGKIFLPPGTDPTTDITNCYYLSGCINGSNANDKMIGSGNARDIDGGYLRENDQGSGAKTSAQMKATVPAGNPLDNARNGLSIYYIGDTDGTAGWDFNVIWSIADDKNDGYPILTGSHAPRTYSVTLTPGEGYALSGEPTATGGSDYTFTLAIDPAYNRSSPTVTAVGMGTLTPAGATYTVPNVNSDIVITVSGVVRNTYTITVSGAGAGGSFTYRIGSADYADVTGNTITGVPHGSTVSIKGVPNAGYAFAWSPSTGSDTLTYTVTSDGTVAGAFAPTGGNGGGGGDDKRTDDGKGSGGSLWWILLLIAIIAVCVAVYVFVVKKRSS